MPFVSKHDWGIATYGEEWLPFVKVGEPNQLAIEIGTFQGRSAYWMLEHVLTHETARIICIDPFENNPAMFDGADMGDYYSEFKANLAEYWNKISVIRAYSTEAHEQLAGLARPGTATIGYVDGSHEYQNSIHDAMLLAPYVKLGGILVFDDIGPDSHWSGPWEAFLEFQKQHRHFEEVVRHTQGILRRVG